LYEVGGMLGVKTSERKKEYTQLLCSFLKENAAKESLISLLSTCRLFVITAAKL